jgi:hypothetical protein
LKICSKCKEEKELNSFSKNSHSKSGLKSQCKSCCTKSSKLYRENNVDKIIEYREKSKEVKSIKSKEHYKNNSDAIKAKTSEWSKNNVDKAKNYRLKHYNKNREYYRLKSKEWESNKRSECPEYKLIRNLRSLIGSSFSRIIKLKIKKSKKSEHLLGCDFEFFIDYIVAQFKNGMTIENYGEWELDHIKPIASANSVNDVEKLNHYTNFRPLWKKDNRRKHSKIEEIQLKLI